MTDNKYEKAFYEWVRLGDEMMDAEGEDVFRLLNIWQEKSKEFEVAFGKAEKWDKISTAMKGTVRDILKEKRPNSSQFVVYQILASYLLAVGEDVQSLATTARKEE